MFGAAAKRVNIIYLWIVTNAQVIQRAFDLYGLVSHRRTWNCEHWLDGPLSEAHNQLHNGDIITLVVCVLWFLWKARNSTKFHKDTWTPRQVIYWIWLYATDISKAFTQQNLNS